MAGHHGAGAAKYAVKHYGAVYGQGEGHFGNSYALPTKGWYIENISLSEINRHVEKFIRYAIENPDLKFQVTRVGCGLGGKKDNMIAPMFYHAPENCIFDDKWKPYLGDYRQYWGTYI